MTSELVSLGILFICAIVGGAIASRFKQPAVFGLLLIGAIIGPHFLNIVKDMSMITIMSDFGAILLLFIIGLEFDLSKLIKLGARSFLIGLLKFAILLFIGYECALLLGLSNGAAIFIGVILSFSSTVVVVKVLEQKEMFSRKEVPLLVAILVIEDIIAVLVLTFFSGVSGLNSNLTSTFERIILSIVILLAAYFIMLKLLKYIVNLLVRNARDDSVLTFLSLGIGALFSYFASVLGLTPTAGAFLAGSLIASLPNAKEYGRAIHPYALIFTSIFFISMGTLVDFKSIEMNMGLIATLLIAGIAARFIAIGALTYILANFRHEQPFFASIAMISVGEFSLLVAKEGQKFGIGIDLVTITASLIFISAILMSLTINYSENAYWAVSSRFSNRMRANLTRISSYMRRLFDQLEIENFFTKKLETESKLAFLVFSLTIFSLFLLRRVFSFLKQLNSNVISLIFYVAGALIVLYLLTALYKKLVGVHQTLSVILTHVDSSRNLKKCTMMLNSMLISLVLLLAALFFPFAIFLLDLNSWMNAIPFVLIILSLYYAKRVILLIDRNSVMESPFADAIRNRF